MNKIAEKIEISKIGYVQMKILLY